MGIEAIQTIFIEQKHMLIAKVGGVMKLIRQLESQGRPG